ncbi:glycosyltransferase family 4 protein [Marinobacter sp. M3C]|jgi:glycosyltransferase involved in cell wall biosynthesis|uniref:glycosyltransferase family 4 protein n=1 Tax=Marinobacter sp. M3C TaxID=2917715 RepID=UPI00200F1502|nr:glycosyltransferase family 4 protein [Marinobacter sp. M3C]MCL1477300.1 glycosyltransferase family 4 protein [Marinobacter sp.]UQG61800.1 glycosyltransferase family 4 protein [Marinobacter sp. M3C]
MQMQPAIWFPTVRTNTGTDIFTQRLVKGLKDRGIRAEVTWLPLRAEYAPWTVRAPKPPEWATVVHVNTWLHPRFIPKTLPAIATIHHAVHHPDALGYKGWLRAAYHKHWIAPMERRVMRRARKVIAVSQFVADTAKKTLVDVPMQLIYNGIDTDIFTPGTRVRLPEEPFRLLYVGSWKALKGVDLLAPIMSELGDTYELHYTGGPTSKKDKATMPPNMRDIGRLNGDAEVAKAMQNADALLFPSRSEGFGLVAAEAMACGLPVFASAGSSVIEVIDHKKNGYLCKRDSIADFTRAIRHLASNDSLRRKMSSSARLSAKNRFSENIMLSAYTLQCYTQV